MTLQNKLASFAAWAGGEVMIDFSKPMRVKENPETAVHKWESPTYCVTISYVDSYMPVHRPTRQTYEGDEIVKISELILAIGDDNVRFQNLLNDAHTIDKTKHGTKITFYTDAIQAEELMFGAKKTKNIGLVLWLPRDKVDSAMAKDTAS